MTTYKLTDSQLATAEAKLTQLNKLATKLGTPPITMTQLDTAYELMPVGNDNSFVAMHSIEIIGTAPQLEGWSFVAAIQHQEHGNVIATLAEYDLNDYPNFNVEHIRNAPPRCVHCGVKRNRKKTFLVTNFSADDMRTFVTTGVHTYEPTYMQVGSTCVSDFLGHDDPHKFIGLLEGINEFLDNCTTADDDGFGGRSSSNVHDHMLHLPLFLSHVVAVIEHYGWISVKESRETIGILSTRERAERSYFDALSSDIRRQAEAMVIKQNHVDDAVATINYVRTTLAEKPLLTRSDYEHNVIVTCADDYTEMRNAGIVASTVNAYYRQREHDLRRSLPSTSQSQFLLKIGARMDADELRCVYIRPIDGEFGTSYMHKFVDPFGNVFIWFTKTLLEQGELYKIRCTMKDHREYEGERQNVVTRGKVLSGHVVDDGK